MASRPRPPFERKLPDLPDVRGPRAPHGYRPGLQLVERLQGLLLLGLGVAGLLFCVYLLNGARTAGPLGTAGGGVPGSLNAAGCLVPMIALGSLGLVLVGLRRIVDP